MTVDLETVMSNASEVEGAFHLSGGGIAYTLLRRSDSNNDTFRLRYESGCWMPYSRDGTRQSAGYTLHKDGTVDAVTGGNKRNIVAVELMSWRDAAQKYPNIMDGITP